MSALPAPYPGAELEFLPMAEADLDAVMAIEQMVHPFPWSRGNFVDSLLAGYACWVGRIAGRIVGYVVVMPVVDESHLLNISVDAAWQGRGLGARLLRHAMRVGRRGGAERLLLEVRPSNTAALRLYEHFGFVRIGVRRNYYPAAEGREDAYVLVHPLAEERA